MAIERSHELLEGDALRRDFGWALGVVFRAYLKAANEATGTLPGGRAVTRCWRRRPGGPR